MKRILSLCLAALMCVGLLCLLAPESRADASPVRKGSRTITSARDLKTYDIVTFGAYPTRSYNEYADIEWIVLNTSGNKATLLAKDLLDSCPYNRLDSWVSWEYCDLNKWLNDAFVTTAFRAAEQTLISGDVTIPSVEEARYLPMDLRYPVFTGYAVSRGGDEQQGIWWLRDRNLETNLGNGIRTNVASVVQRGVIREACYKVTFHGKGIRPMLQIDFDCLDQYTNWSRKEDSRALGLMKKNGQAVTSSDDVRLYDDLTFGSYPQSYYGDPSPIHWVVIGKEGSRLKLLSQFVLDNQRYQDPYGMVSWRFCTLNSWLNGTFLSTAFTQEEQTVLGSDVALLTAEEARDLPRDLRPTAPTQYAVGRGVAPSICIWWLQDTMIKDGFFCGSVVLQDGEIGDGYFSVNSCKAIRPVIEIDLSIPSR